MTAGEPARSSASSGPGGPSSATPAPGSLRSGSEPPPTSPSVSTTDEGTPFSCSASERRVAFCRTSPGLAGIPASPARPPARPPRKREGGGREGGGDGLLEGGGGGGVGGGRRGVRGPPLDEPAARLGEDLGDAESSPDLDQFAARNHRRDAARQGRQRQERRSRAVVHHVGGFGREQLAPERLDV